MHFFQSRTIETALHQGALLMKAYWLGYWISSVILFVGCWIYCIKSYGFLIGVGIGWLPSAIAAGLFSLGGHYSC
jgi:hypothetical protein